MKNLNDVNFKDQKVFLRADLNVPLNDDLEITDDNRIKNVIPTIKHIIENGGKLIIASHLGRPGGERVEKFSLKPVANKIGELLETDIKLANDCVGEEVLKLSGSLNSGDILLLENLRFHKEETSNDSTFSKELSKLADIYINDAFGVSHREHASIVGITEFFDIKASGFLMDKEIEYYNKTLVDPKRPLCIVVGGAKVSSKLSVLNHISEKAD
ncbi:UNVERIFIED_CONTAM: hypothetical protein GTU68_042593, partial [Idotea baltica]|nr:hypothetical protein [Idotea baltica]